jgi:uncharacterized membrane protein
MGGEAVPQRVHGNALVELGRRRRRAAGAVHLACGDRLAGLAARKQPSLRPLQSRNSPACSQWLLRNGARKLKVLEPKRSKNHSLTS